MKLKFTIKYHPLCLGLGLAALAASSAWAQNSVTFQVDMTQVPVATDVYVRGSFNGYGTSNPLTNDGTGVFTGAVAIADSPGTVEQYKFYYEPGQNWESPASTCGNNRTFTLAGGNQTLPVVYYNDAPPVLPPNDVTLQVDMTAQVLTGAFTNGQSTVAVSGSFTGWGNGSPLTNNPALLGNASNVYSTVLTINGVVGACQSYKFRANGGWESPASTGGNNRTFQIAGGAQTLPLVFYNDSSLCDIVQQDTSVTFQVHVTNGTVAADGHVFDNTADQLYLNGEFLGWWAWDTGFGGSEGAQYQMTNNPVGSDYYQQTFLVPKGKNLAVTYKYSINGFDNEAGFGVNHVRYIRTLSGIPYNMPTDQFGTNLAPPIIEKSFGNLKVGANPNTPGRVVITWDGRQCVTLQTRTNVAAGLWQNVPATEGTSATNWPISGSQLFFRLQKTP